MLALGLLGISAAVLADFRTQIGIISYNNNVIYIIQIVFQHFEMFFSY